MMPWSDPIQRVLAGSLAPRGRRDARGWLVGRGWLPVCLRVLPAAGVALSALPWLAAYQATLPMEGPWRVLGPLLAMLVPLEITWAVPAETLAWLLPAVAAPLVVAAAAAAGTSACWRNGRMEEWLASPMRRREITDALIASWAVPGILAVLVGTLYAAGLWAALLLLGAPLPPHAPLQGLLVAAQTCAGVFSGAAVGVLTGARSTHPGTAAAVAASLAGVGLAVAAGQLVVALGASSAGRHLALLPATWIAGRAARSLAPISSGWHPDDRWNLARQSAEACRQRIAARGAGAEGRGPSVG